MTTLDLTCRRPVRRDLGVPILGRMTTPPRWLREHRRTVRAAAGPGSPAAGISPTTWKPPVPVDWGKSGDAISDEEWAPFIAAIEEAKGRPLVG